MKKHDEHYASMEIEPVAVSEQLMKVNAQKIPAWRVYHLAKVVEYIMRAGLKKGQNYQKELEKALNHLHRAIYGRWYGEE